MEFKKLDYNGSFLLLDLIGGENLSEKPYT